MNRVNYKNPLGNLDIKDESAKSPSSLFEKPVPTYQYIKDYVLYAEFKRTLDRIHSACVEKNIRSLSVISLVPEEGKTFFSIGLATGFAELMSKKVLLVDAGNPEAKLCIEDYYPNSDESYYDQVPMVVSLSEGVDLFRLANFKPTNYKAQEYRVQDILAEYSQKYDLVIFDSAALKLTNRGNFDPWIIANRTDASVLVTSKKSVDLIQAQHLEGLTRIKLIGVIENQGAD